MLKIPFLRNILLLSLVFAVVLPLYDYFYIYPSYRELLIEETEDEASRFVRFLVTSHRLDQFELSTDSIPPSVAEEVGRLQEDVLLVKLRIFDPAGKIVFSTKAEELNHINRKDYFRLLVAQGNVYSKVVQKDSLTADGVLTTIDVVETYVPIMFDGHFHGAVEVYYDITENQQQLSGLTWSSGLMLFAISCSLLLIVMLVLFRAKKMYLAQQQAEAALQEANELLEQRVVERTEQLVGANRQLETEVGERRRAEEALRLALGEVSEARDHIDAIISSVADGLLVTDREDRLVLMNRSAEELFQVSLDKVLGKQLPDIIGFDDLLLKISRAKKELGEGLSGYFDFELTHRGENQPRIYHARTSILTDQAGERRGMVVLLQDVTRVREVERMKSEFVSMAAHELQTPLTMILGYSELLQEEDRSFAEQERQEFLNIINDKAVALSKIVDDMLDISRIEEGRALELKREQVELGSLVRGAVGEFATKGGQHQFALDLPEHPLPLAVDRGRLQQLMRNLLSNALKYSPDGGEVQVQLRKLETGVEIEVVDRGIGMTPKQLERVFDRFYRADASNTSVQGTGLGLSIVKYIVDGHGGDIQVFSQQGEGTRIRIILPG